MMAVNRPARARIESDLIFMMFLLHNVKKVSGFSVPVSGSET
jgi:hypothetical protein